MEINHTYEFDDGTKYVCQSIDSLIRYLHRKNKDLIKEVSDITSISDQRLNIITRKNIEITDLEEQVKELEDKLVLLEKNSYFLWHKKD